MNYECYAYTADGIYVTATSRKKHNLKITVIHTGLTVEYFKIFASKSGYQRSRMVQVYASACTIKMLPGNIKQYLIKVPY